MSRHPSWKGFDRSRYYRQNLVSKPDLRLNSNRSGQFTLMGWSGRAPAPPASEAGKGAKDKEHAVSQTPTTAIVVIGIDIGKNSFHDVGHDARGAIVPPRLRRPAWTGAQADLDGRPQDPRQNLGRGNRYLRVLFEQAAWVVLVKRLMHRNKQHRHSITSSARPSSESGTVRPRALAVFRSANAKP